MLHASTQQLIRKLCELTEDGAIAWKEGEAGRCIFETEGYVVEIAGEPPSVRLLRLDGRELEHAAASDLALAWPDGDGTYAAHVSDMARIAGRHARGAETAIAKILSSLSAPPKTPAEPEPEPAALAFADMPPPATERVAALAAVNAGLEARTPVEEPPVLPAQREAPSAVEVSPETETAIDRVLAVQPAPQPSPVITEAEPAPIVVEAALAEPEPEADIEPASTIPPILIDEQEPAPAASEPEPARVTSPEPEPVIALTRQADPLPASPAAPEPKPFVLAPRQAEPPAPRPAPIAASAKAGFGATSSFVRSPPPAPHTPASQPPMSAFPAAQRAMAQPSAPHPEATKVTSTGLLMRGFSARTLQTVDAASARDILRHAAKSGPPLDREADAAAKGADIYKPWA